MNKSFRRQKSIKTSKDGHAGHPMRLSEPLVGFEPTTPRLQITCSGQLS